ncbi:hypothetical protein DIPPA_10378 [Diplonema papillatum]|nr:hypothetical protein DIPPA_10378 [Diplonema papillatum]
MNISLHHSVKLREHKLPVDPLCVMPLPHGFTTETYHRLRCVRAVTGVPGFSNKREVREGGGDWSHMMSTVWIRRAQDPEHAEIKVSVANDGHVSDVLQKAAGMLVFSGEGRFAGGLQASIEGRVLSNKEHISPYEGRSLIISERAQYSAGTPADRSFPNAMNNPGSLASSRSPKASYGMPLTSNHVCAKCSQPVLGLKVVLTLPGSNAPVDLHPDCEMEYERSHALQCNFCSDLILDRLTTLTGDFGTINLHPQCVDQYKRAPPEQQRVSARDPTRNYGDPAPWNTQGSAAGWSPQRKEIGVAGGSAVGGRPSQAGAGGEYTCAQCGSQIEGTKVSLKLPGFNYKADLHPQCEYQYAVNHALRCDFCQQPMLDGITVLTGLFGNAKSRQLHPACVSPFKQQQNGHGAAPVPWNDSYVPSNTQWKPVQGAAFSSQSAVSVLYRGRRGDTRVRGAAAKSRGPKCRLKKKPGFNYKADLHPQCEYQYAVNHALRCDFCQQPMLDGITVLTGLFGNAKSRQLHPACVSPFEQQQNGHGAAPVPWNDSYVPSNTQWKPVQGAAFSSQSAVRGVGAIPGPAGRHTRARCGSQIEGTKVSLKLPGFNYKADLHPQCEYQYAVNHALRCDFCQQPMLDGITVLTGLFGNAKSRQLHPACVSPFKQQQNGHGAAPVPWNDSYVPSNTQWKPVQGAAFSSQSAVRWAPTAG